MIDINKVKWVKISSYTLLYILSYTLKLYNNRDLKLVFNLKIVTSSHDLCVVWVGVWECI